MFNYLVGLSKKNNQDRSYVGSGFFICQNWMITAKHVLLDFFELDWDSQNAKGAVDCSIVAASYNKHNSLIWQVYEAYAIKGSDLALLKSRLLQGKEKEDEIKYPTLNMKMPKKGEILSGLGFPTSKINDKGSTVEWFIGMDKSEGTLDEVHSQLRDSYMVNYPSYQISTNFRPGMSGGPVLNLKNEVIGVVSTGIDKDLSYAAAIWPIQMYIDEYEIEANVINLQNVAVIRNPESNELTGISYLGR